MSKYQTCAHSAPWQPPIPLDDEEKGYPVGRFCKHACGSMAVIRDPEVCESCTQYTDPTKLITINTGDYLELLEQLNGEHCLTFYGYQHDRDRILEALKKHRKDLRVRVYKTVEDEEAWNNGEVDVLLVHPASCAYGLNLQAGGQHVVWYGLNWSFELNDQGNCRLYRQGSPYDKVFVHYLVVQGCQDEDVMATVRDRQDTHEAVMSALKARIKRVKESAK